VSTSAPQYLSAFVCLLLFFWGLGDIPFSTKGEPREAVVVWEIYTNGEWVLPLRNGIEIPSKPLLFHWLGAFVSYALGGINELTVRLPSAILATLGVLLTCLAGTRLWGKEAGLIAPLVLATSFEWWRAATIARVDMTLTFFMVAAFLFFFSLYREGKSGRGKTLVLALLLGLATLAKGPVGAFLPCLTAGVFLGLRHDFAFIKKLHPLTGAALFLLVAGSWYALATWWGGERFFVKQLVQENLLRFVATEAGGTGHQHPFYYFIPNLFLGMAPWSFFFPPLALFLYHRRHTLAQDRTFKPFMARVSQVVGGKTPLFFYQSFDYGALFYARRHIPHYREKLRSKQSVRQPACPTTSGIEAPFFLLMWEEEWERAQTQALDNLSLIDISEGATPKGTHRLALVSVQEGSP
jgi:4-amino-4-deoxy-L-arabinose transferase-like glycosyltransferase